MDGSYRKYKHVARYWIRKNRFSVPYGPFSTSARSRTSARAYVRANLQRFATVKAPFPNLPGNTGPRRGEATRRVDFTDISMRATTEKGQQGSTEGEVCGSGSSHAYR